MSTIVSNIDVAGFQGEGLDIIGTEGADTLFGTNDGELINGLGGDDVISASDGDDLLIGGAGADTLGAGAGDDSVLGNKGGDLIFAYDGDDMVDAGLGNDIVYSGEGSDTLFGGQGADSFVFELEDFEDGSTDVISDFELGEDKLVILGLGAEDAIAFDTSTGGITVNGEEIIVLENTSTPEEFELL